MSKTIKIGFAGLSLAVGLQFATTPARATLLAYEGFNYTNAVGISISGLNGGTGWSEAWPAPNPPVILTNGLTYNLANTVGKAVRMSTSGNMGTAGRNWTSGATLTTGTYWYSFFIRPDSTGAAQPGRGTFCAIMDSASNQNGFGMRLDNNAGSPQFKAWNPQQAQGPNLDFPGGYDQTYFVIGKAVIDKSNPGVSVSTNTIWVFQDPASMPSSEGSLTGGSTCTSASANLSAQWGGRAFGDSSPISYDELRVGTSFADVIPILGSFALSPSSAIEGQNLDLSWAVPTNFTSVTLDPGAISLTGLTSVDGTGSTNIPAPTVNTTYVISYQNGGPTVYLTNQFTALAPSFTLNPTNGWEGDVLTFNWQVPVGSTAVSINPTVGSVTPDGIDGTGVNSISAPNASTEYVLTYTYNSVTFSKTNQFTLAAPYFSIPTTIVANTANTITWRIPVGFTDVVLEYGPVGGPYAVADLFTSTVTTNGFGTVPFFPAATNLSYFLRYTNSGTGYVLSSNIVVYPEIFTDLTATGNGKAVLVNPYLLYAGVPAYSDRSHAWDQVPTIIQGAQFVKFGQDDKTQPALQVSFTAATNCTFFLLLDNRVGDGVGGTNAPAGTDNPPTLTSVMAWVLSSGFVDSGVDIGLDENPAPPAVSVDQTYSVYFRQVSAGETYTFYEQNDGSQRNMYGMAAVAPQVVPVAFVGNPDVITNGSATTLQWTVPLGSTAKLTNWLNGVTNNLGNVDVDGTFGTGITNIIPALGTNFYTLTYDPPGAGTPAVKLGPVSVVVLPFAATFTATPSVIVEGASSTLGWTVPIDSTVTIDNGVGDVTGSTGGGVGSIPVAPPSMGTYSYTLTYDPPGPSTSETVGPITLIVSANYSTNITVGSITGNTLTLTWPATHLGWYVSSNSVDLADTSFWFDVPNSETNTSLNVTIDPSQTNVFYRLRIP